MMPFYDSLQPSENAPLTSGLVWHTCAVFKVGDVVRKVRTEKKPRIGLLKLAALTGLNKGTLSRLERGEIDPKYSTLERIAEALGVPVAHLVTPPSASQPIAMTGSVTPLGTNLEDDAVTPSTRELAATVEAQGREIADLRNVLDTLLKVAGKQTSKASHVPARRGKGNR